MTPVATSPAAALAAAVHNAIQQVSEVYGRLLEQQIAENAMLRAQLAIAKAPDKQTIPGVF